MATKKPCVKCGANTHGVNALVAKCIKQEKACAELARMVLEAVAVGEECGPSLKDWRAIIKKADEIACE